MIKMHNNCKCAMCELKAKGFTEEQIRTILEEKGKIFIEQYGFYCHYNCHGDYIDCHTHGVKESFNHMDLQIVFPIPQQYALGIMHNIVNLIKTGTPFNDGDIIYDGIIQSGYPVKFKKIQKGKREVLRILICDKNKRLPDEEYCDFEYKKQLRKNI